MKRLVALTYLVASLLLSPLVVATSESSDADRWNPMAVVKGFAITTETKSDDIVMHAAECDSYSTGH